MMSSVISFAYLHIFQTKLMQIFANGKRRFDSFMDLYVVHLKYQGVKI